MSDLIRREKAIAKIENSMLIDADDLKEKVKKIHPWEPYPSKYAEGIRHCMEVTIAIIDEQPTIEAEKKVIHCIDCRYACIEKDRESDEVYCSEMDFYPSDDFYCGYAKKRGLDDV